MRRRHPSRVVGLATALVAALVAVGCSSSDSSPSSSTNPPTTTAAPIEVGAAPVRLELIRPAVEAVEAQLAGPQQYFEVNATPTLVNLFVATENGSKAVAYVYTKQGLEPPAEPQPASGPMFGAAEMTFDETRVMALAVAQLPSSTFRVFAVTGVQGGGVAYRLTVDSELGSEFQVMVGPAGDVLGTDRLTPGES